MAANTPNLPARRNLLGLTAKEKKERDAEIAQRRDKVVSKMNKTLLSAAEEVAKVYEQWREGNFKRQWSLGKRLKAIQDNEVKYGHEPLTSIAVYIGYDVTTLYQAVNFYTQFDEDRLEDLVSRRLKTSGLPITWTYVMKLLAVYDVKKQNKLMDEICDNDLTPDELAAIISNNGLTKGSNNPAGRPVKPPATVTGRLESFAKIAHMIDRRDDEIWRSDKYGFVASIQDMPADKITTDLVGKIEANIEAAQQAIDTLSADKAALEEALELANQRAEDHANAVADKVAADDAEVEAAAAEEDAAEPELDEPGDIDAVEPTEEDDEEDDAEEDEEEAVDDDPWATPEEAPKPKGRPKAATVPDDDEEENFLTNDE